MATTQASAPAAVPPMRFSAEDRALLGQLRHKRRERRGRPPHRAPSAGERMADAIARWVGSWPFVLGQSAILALWIVLNVVAWVKARDPYPFILLNLALSFQAAYAAPIIMMSQNRQAAIDRNVQTHDYEVNLKAELEIEQLHQKIDLLREQEVVALTKTVRELVAAVERLKGAGA
jgi:uncharacterized membrane protein